MKWITLRPSSYSVIVCGNRDSAGDPRTILNRAPLVDGVKTEIIGVMPPDFRIADENALYWTPIPFNKMQLRGSGRYMLAIGRMKPGVSIPQAQADMDAVAAQLAREAPGRDTDHGKPWGVRVLARCGRFCSDS